MIDLACASNQGRAWDKTGWDVILDTEGAV
jgi:hypothetical protein